MPATLPARKRADGVRQALGGLDILFVNAAIADSKPLAQRDDSRLHHTFRRCALRLRRADSWHTEKVQCASVSEKTAPRIHIIGTNQVIHSRPESS